MDAHRKPVPMRPSVGAAGTPAVAHPAPIRGWAAAIALATLGTVCSSVDVWVLMTVLFPILQNVWEPAVSIQAAIAAAGYALVALLALRAPRRVNPVPMGIASGVLIIAGTAVWGQGMATADPLLATVGACAAHFGCSWPRIMVGVALCALGNKRDLVIAAVLGEGIGALLRCVLPGNLGMVAALGLVTVTELAMLAASHAGGASFVRRAAMGSARADLDTTNPDSFVGPTHRLFVLIAFFELIHGISLAGKPGGSALLVNIAVTALVAAAGVWLIAHRGPLHEDALLHAAALLMLGGFMVQPLTPAETALSNTLSFAGAALSWVLIWIVFASVGMGNPAGALRAIGTGYTMQALGLEAGSLLGRLANGMPGTAGSAYNVVSAAMVVAFIGYLLVGLRGFSFSRAFAGIVPVAPLRPLDDPESHIDRRCRELAQSCGLSERELEVAGMLARGKTGQEIQDCLTVSRNTVKTHVRHIYRKLDVHSQQELIDLVGLKR